MCKVAQNLSIFQKKILKPWNLPVRENNHCRVDVHSHLKNSICNQACYYFMYKWALSNLVYFMSAQTFSKIDVVDWFFKLSYILNEVHIKRYPS